MTTISRLAELITEDVNNEESVIISFYSRFLSVLFNLVLWLGIPYMIYLMIAFGQNF